MAWLSLDRHLVSAPLNFATGFAKFSSKSSPYYVKIGIPEFLNGVGKGVEKHVEKLESEIKDLNKLLVTRTMKLKRLGIPCQDGSDGFSIHRNAVITVGTAVLQFRSPICIPVLWRKLILKHTHKYRLGLWRPRAEPVKSYMDEATYILL